MCHDWMDRSRSRLHVLLYFVLGLTAGLLPSSASAAVYDLPDQGLAFEQCVAAKAHAQTFTAQNGDGDQVPAFHSFKEGMGCSPLVVNSSTSEYKCQFYQKSVTTGLPSNLRSCATHAIGSDTFRFPNAAMCSERDTQQNGWAVDQDPESSNDVCDLGCHMDYSLDITGGNSTNVWTPSGETCDESEIPPPEDDADNDGTPDDEDAFPNDPSEDTDTDGDGVGDNADTAPEDETNGDDDGSGDETDNSAAGGGTCAAPPSCTGDGIACASLHQQWQTRCAIERLNDNLTGNGNGDGEGPGEDEGPDWGEGDGSSPTWAETDISTSMLNTDGFMGAGSCPEWGPIEILGESYTLPQVHCDILEWIGYLVVMVALVVAARILGS